MKCPKCSLTLSTSKDTCPKCRLDLTPFKKRLGLSTEEKKPKEENKLEKTPEKTPTTPATALVKPVALTKNTVKNTEPAKEVVTESIPATAPIIVKAIEKSAEPGKDALDTSLEELMEATKRIETESGEVFKEVISPPSQIISPLLASGLLQEDNAQNSAYETQDEPEYLDEDMDGLFELSADEIQRPIEIEIQINATQSKNKNLINTSLTKVAEDISFLSEKQNAETIDSNEYTDLTGELTYAPLNNRALSLFIDIFLVFGLSFAFSWISIFTPVAKNCLLGRESIYCFDLYPGISSMTLAFFIIWLIWETFLVASNGQTVGCKLLNIEIRDVTGMPVLFSQAFLRACGHFLNLITLGIWSAFLLKNKQLPQDIVSNTKVVLVNYTDDD